MKNRRPSNHEKTHARRRTNAGRAMRSRIGGCPNARPNARDVRCDLELVDVQMLASPARRMGFHGGGVGDGDCGCPCCSPLAIREPAVPKARVGKPKITKLQIFFCNDHVELSDCDSGCAIGRRSIHRHFSFDGAGNLLVDLKGVFKKNTNFAVRKRHFDDVTRDSGSRKNYLWLRYLWIVYAIARVAFTCQDSDRDNNRYG